MKLMTFNTQHCRNFVTGKIDIPLMADTVRKTNADIVALQEMYGNNSDGEKAQSEQIADDLGFYSYFAPAITLSGYKYGNAIISRYPIISAENIIVSSDGVRVPGRYFETRCIINARIDTPDGIMNVIATHFGLQPEEAALSVREIEKLADFSYPSCLMGDLNLTPDSEILKPILELYRDTAAYIQGCNFTFPSDKPNCKIDYILVGGNVSVKNAEIPELIAADHRVVTAEVEINKG